MMTSNLISTYKSNTRGACLFFIVATAAFLALPLKTAWATQNTFPSPQSRATESGEPKWTSDSGTFRFGTVYSGGKVDIVFQFSNTGSAPLKIFSVHPACGCTQLDGWDREIAPGQRGRITLRLDTTGLSGKVVRKVTVNTNLPRNPTVVLFLSGQVDPILDLSPGEFAFGKIPTGSPPVSKNMRLSSRLQNPIRLKAVSSSVPGFTFSLQEKIPGREFLATLQTPAHPAPGAYAGNLRLEIFIPQKHIVFVPFTAWVPAELEIQPETLMLPSGPLPEDLERTIFVQKQKPFTLTRLASNVPGLKVTSVKNDNQGLSHCLIISLKAGSTLPPGDQSWIEFATDDSALGTRRIPVRIFASQTQPSTTGPGILQSGGAKP